MSVGMSREVYRDLRGHLMMAEDGRDMAEKMVLFGLAEKFPGGIRMTARGTAYYEMQAIDPTCQAFVSREPGTC